MQFLFLDKILTPPRLVQMLFKLSQNYPQVFLLEALIVGKNNPVGISKTIVLLPLNFVQHLHNLASSLNQQGTSLSGELTSVTLVVRKGEDLLAINLTCYTK